MGAGALQVEKDWRLSATLTGKKLSVGSRAAAPPKKSSSRTANPKLPKRWQSYSRTFRLAIEVP
jgi:hypothetical protein